MSDVILSSSPARETAQASLTIDLGALAANWALLAARVAPAECGAVVKADAYGIGIEAAVPALAKVGCKTFFVAHASEGVRVRTTAPQATIYVLNGLPHDSVATLLEHNLRPVLGSMENVGLWQNVPGMRACARSWALMLRGRPSWAMSTRRLSSRTIGITRRRRARAAT